MTMPILTIDRDRASPPRITVFTQPFWRALAQGEFQVTKCEACGRMTFPPREFCRHCWSRDTHWLAMSGRGKLYSHTYIHALPEIFANEPGPLHVGIVDLDEGVRVALPIVHNAVDSAVGDAPALDAPIELVVLAYRDGPLFGARTLVDPGRDSA